ncbi:hypothetical protein FQA39_LY16029 [Lamprigera yunnana]|nr:hypothetical protein FQA39_LY16029 [Lamprigera yunnana]
MNLGSLDSRFSSISSRVDFIDVRDHYTYNEDLICRYCLTDYQVQEGDRIAIFKLGWQFIKDYILFEWAPKDVPENFVVFNKHRLPKNTTEIYQFCFISGENNVHGASEPFQFVEDPKSYQSLFRYMSHKGLNSLPDEYKSLSNSSAMPINIPDVIERDREMLRLKEENQFLRSTLKLLVEKQSGKQLTADVEILKKSMSELQFTLFNQQNQIKNLQIQVTNSINYKKSQNDNLECACGGLKKNFQKDLNINTEFDLGELESIPPFPFAK